MSSRANTTIATVDASLTASGPNKKRILFETNKTHQKVDEMATKVPDSQGNTVDNHSKSNQSSSMESLETMSSENYNDVSFLNSNTDFIPSNYLEDNDDYDMKSDKNNTKDESTEEEFQNGKVAINNKKIQVVHGILLRIMLPLANGLARSIRGFREVRFLSLMQSVASSRQMLTNLIAFAANTISMNLSSVQVSHRIELFYNYIKIPKRRNGLENLTPTADSVQITAGAYSPLIREPKGSQSTPLALNAAVTEEEALKCCTLNILAAPPADQPIRADVVFIHGLHGSLVNTWKQGLWENERHPINFKRPPKPPVRPPKRSRHSRSTYLRPPHKQKRLRLSNSELNKSTAFRDADESQKYSLDFYEDDDDKCFTFVCGESEDIQMCDDLEYSFPRFRLRIKDNGLQAEIEPIAPNDSNANNDGVSGAANKNTSSKAISPNDPNYSKCWPGDWLPLDCPGVRVIAVNYTTDQYLWRPIWKKKESRTSLIQRSREMAKLLIDQGVGLDHPIIWVGHSKGGLFIKQIIVDAWESERTAMANLWRSSKGCFFYSVPHRGSPLASIKAPLLSRSVELIDIEKNSKYLSDLHRRFVGLYHLGHLKIEIFSFVEMALTLMSVLYLRIVGVDSADPGIGDVCGIRLDHREICKPRSRDCILYKELVKMINKVC